MSEWLLEVEDLKTYFSSQKSFFGHNSGSIKAVDGVSFQLKKGETLGIVGESGCGKSTTGRSILRLIKPTSGSIKFEGVEVTGLSQGELRKLRKRMQLVFQDPYASLNPRMSVYSILEEALSVRNQNTNRMERREQVLELLQLVGLNPNQADKYPHEFSGGQRQRIGIARALAVQPSLIIADEPVSALDVSIQAQILNLLKDLQESLDLTFIFISHDLSVIRHFSDRIAVMYLGGIVEISRKDQLFSKPYHPYSQALMSAVLKLDPTKKSERIILHGDVPNPSNPPRGCTFHPRCSHCMEICKTERPKAIEVEPGHFVSCYLYKQP
ncbi:ABC transporter ATP-binding protein [Brevibacillus daliensis]|uniref:ABC transporter ATP-binding protein n=1 Tax=Brevibacillus daliensis TaxID=2892995 RepID=UPI001E3A712E|nr:dipeptide ABC transporter ATP-binding protein [Brevibacillus daliensis]